MGTSAYSDLFAQCLPELPGVPDPTLENALNNAAIKLCVKAGVWREDQTITLIADQPEYDLDLPMKTRLRQIEAVKYADLEIFPKTPEELDYLMPGWQVQKGGPSYYFGSKVTDSAITLRVVPTPTADVDGKTMLVSASFVPLIGSTTFDAELLERHGEAIACGAKGALMRMPKQLWTDKVSAVDYDNQFQTAIDKARIDILHRYTTGAVHVRPRRFGY